MPVYFRCQSTPLASLLGGFAEHHGTGGLLAASAAACADRATGLRRDKRRVRGIASVGGRPQFRRRATGGLPQGNDGSGGRRRRATGTEPSAAAAAREGPLQLQFRARDGSGVGGRTGPERDAAAVHLAVLDRRRLVAASTTAAGAFHRAGELIPVLLQREQAVRAPTEAAAAAPRGERSLPGSRCQPNWPPARFPYTIRRTPFACCRGRVRGSKAARCPRRSGARSPKP